MNLPPPIVKDMSCILVSKKRLITVLGHLGLLPDTADGRNLLDMIHSLWRESHEYTNGSIELTTAGSNDSNYNGVSKHEDDSRDTTSSHNDGDVEEVSDLIQLGTLKWILYGFPARQPSWFSCFCLPCGMTPSEAELDRRQSERAQAEHPVVTSGMKRRHGELVRHDVMTCKLCNNATGCPACHDDDDSASEADQGQRLSLPSSLAPNPKYTRASSIQTGPQLLTEDENSYVDSTCESVVEVTTIASLLQGEMILETPEEKFTI